MHPFIVLSCPPPSHLLHRLRTRYPSFLEGSATFIALQMGYVGLIGSRHACTRTTLDNKTCAPSLQFSVQCRHGCARQTVVKHTLLSLDGFRFAERRCTHRLGLASGMALAKG